MTTHDVIARTTTPTTDPALQEAESVARAIARGFLRQVEVYRGDHALPRDEAVARVMDEGLGALYEEALAGDLRDVQWWHLGSLAARDPERTQTVWQAIGEAAQDELASGHRAAQALEWAETPWERAQFLAIRESFRAQWQPQGGIEDALIDTLAMSYAEQLHWMAAVTRRVVGEELTAGRILKDEGRWSPPTVTAAEAVDQAVAMVDRFNKIFVRTLRALQQLRRDAGPVVIQHAGQVSVGGQQLNVIRQGGEDDAG